MADLSQSILRRLRDVRDNPRGVLEQLADQLNNFNRGQVAEINDRGAGMRQLSRDERIRQMVENATDNLGGGGMGALGVIKTKGGQWLQGGVNSALQKLKKTIAGQTPEERIAQIQNLIQHQEGAVRPLNENALQRMNQEIDRLQRDAALNKWIDSKLRRYITNDMATQNDPIRKLAEEGILHTKADRLDFHPDNWGNTWNPEQTWHAKNDLAKRWEGVSDNAIGYSQAKTFQDAKNYYDEQVRLGEPPWMIESSMSSDELNRSALAHNEPWLEKMPPEERIFEVAYPKYINDDLGFDQLVTKLSNASADSSLPKHLQLNPDDFQQLSIEKAIRQLNAIDQHKAALALAARADLPVFKDYGDKGFRWLELNKPGSFAAESDAMGHSVRGYEPPKGHPDWIPGSGDEGSEFYGHGGWDAIKEGRAKVYSLIDKQGKPHVTIETSRGSSPNPTAMEIVEQLPEDLLNELIKTHGYGGEGWYHKVGTDPRAQAWAKENLYSDTTPYRITQIKGKQNLKPDAAYTPFVQDLIRSGDWENVQDLSNADLIDMQQLYGDKLPKDASRWMTREEQQAFNQQFGDIKSKLQEELDDPNFNDRWEPDEEFNYAEGGLVRGPDFFDNLDAFLRR